MSRLAKNCDNNCWMEPDYENSTMHKWIQNYLYYHVEPDYEDLCYFTDTDGYGEQIFYNYKTANKIIDQYRTNLQEKLQKKLTELDRFQYLINKNSFANDRKENLINLLDSDLDLFLDKMNKECEYTDPNKTNWTECKLDGSGYCCEKDGNRIICQNCKFFLNAANEHLERYKETCKEDCKNNGHSICIHQLSGGIWCAKCNIIYDCDACKNIIDHMHCDRNKNPTVKMY